ncbi:MAG: hypothetical protein KKB20_22290 [Proteobacteria bacterium]|nr:hypothetical protein [Pseudomonadota bacterium]
MIRFLRTRFFRREARTDPASTLEEYLRVYHDRLDRPEVLTIGELEAVHCRFQSSLHQRAGAEEPNVSAFLYSVLRLPDCVDRVSRVVIGPGEPVFVQAGYADVAAWPRVSARARRRRSHYNGRGTLAIFVTSISDLDDLVPALCAFQIEWNKMHRLLSRGPLGKDLAGGRVAASRAGQEVRRSLGLGEADWELLRRVWERDWDAKISALAREPRSLTVERLPLRSPDFHEAAAGWWDKVGECFGLGSTEDRPIYIVSSNTHGLANLVSGVAAAREGELVDFIMDQDPEGLRRAWRSSSRDPDRNRFDLLYYALRYYLERHPEAKAEKTAREEAAGLTRHLPDHYPFLEAQRIELGRLDPKALDPRLEVARPEALARSRAWILNMDYPLGLAAYHLLSHACRRFTRMKGVFILGKSAATIGRLGDIMIPGEVHDAHSGNRYLFRNRLTIRRLVPFLNRIAAFEDQKSITVRGTFLHGRDTVRDLTRDDFTGIEMEAGPYLAALYEHFTGRSPTRNRVLSLEAPPGFSLGLLHYTSDTPYNVRASLLSRRLGLTGLEAAYASSLAILQYIIDQES